MAHYTINLPGNLHGDVRQGKVLKKTTLFTKNWPWIKLTTDEKAGYVVTISGDGAQYHLIKTKDGNWPAAQGDEISLAVKEAGRWQPIEESEVTLAIKKAIDSYEKEQ